MREVLLDPAQMDRIRFRQPDVSSIPAARRAQLVTAVEELPEGVREVIERYFWQARRPAEIAADMGISRPTVYARLREAMAILETELGGDDRT